MAGTEEDIIVATAGLARRMSIYTILRLASVSMLWGIGIAVALVSVSKFVIIPMPLILALTTILGASLIIGVIRGILARVSALQAAMTADVQLDLKERLSSAVELLEENDRREMAALQLRDAADYARPLDPKAIHPRMFPVTSKVLPLAGLVLILLICAPSRYGRPAEVPAEVRQAIKQAGAAMEIAADEMDENVLSNEVAKLVTEMADTARKLQDDPLTKKEALKDLSNLVRKMEAMKMMGRIAEELRKDMTPEEKRILNELLKNLADDLKDIQGMEKLSQKVVEALRTGLSMEALKEIAAALEQMDIKASDMEALERVAEQVAESKRDVGRSTAGMFRSPKTTGGPDQTGAQADEESGLMGGTAPGRKPAKDMKEQVELVSRRPVPSGEGYDSQIEGQLSEKGRSVSAEIESDLERGESLVPYEEIYVKYRDAADHAITRAKIPWTYRKHVESYFDAIRPKEE